MSPRDDTGSADGYPRPPRTITDRVGREITISAADEGDKAALFAMYRAFDPADRAQGIPPVRDSAIDRWLDTVLAEDCVNVVARHLADADGARDGTASGDAPAIGHATLVPDEQGDYELAIFVLADYQGAGIGTAVLKTLLGRAEAEGIGRVWLTVERWNEAAIALYRSVGFETTGNERFELEMDLAL